MVALRVTDAKLEEGDGKGEEQQPPARGEVQLPEGDEHMQGYVPAELQSHRNVQQGRQDRPACLPSTPGAAPLCLEVVRGKVPMSLASQNVVAIVLYEADALNFRPAATVFKRRIVGNVGNGKPTDSKKPRSLAGSLAQPLAVKKTKL